MDNRDLQKAKLLNSRAVAEIVEKYIGKNNPIIDVLDQNDDGKLDLEDIKEVLDVNKDGEVNVDDLRDAFSKVGNFLDFIAMNLNKNEDDELKYTKYQREENIKNQVSDIETGPVFSISGNFSELPPPAPPSIEEPIMSVKEKDKKKRNWLKRFLFPENVQHHYIHAFPWGPI